MLKVASSEIDCYAETCFHYEDDGCSVHPQGKPFQIGGFGKCRYYKISAEKTVRVVLGTIEEEGQVKPA